MQQCEQRLNFQGQDIGAPKLHVSAVADVPMRRTASHQLCCTQIDAQYDKVSLSQSLVELSRDLHL